MKSELVGLPTAAPLERLKTTPRGGLLQIDSLSQAAQDAVSEFLKAGTAPNTVRSYQGALTYWSAWLQVRYGLALGDGPIPPAVAIQFIVDHLKRPQDDGTWAHNLPQAADHALVDAKIKSALGPHSFNTVSLRMAVLGKWHGIKGWDSPTDNKEVKALMRDAQKAQARGGITIRKKTALVAEPFKAILDTCSADGLRGIRDRALLLLAWSGGGRRRSEVVALQISDVRKLDADTWLYSLGVTKTDTAGVRREKPLAGPAAHALTAWLSAAPIESGPLFRGMLRGGKVGTAPLTGHEVSRIVQKRAKLAGLEGDWGAHSLRSGFVTEAGRQGVPLGDVMSMTEHTSVSTVMGYFQSGNMLNSNATTLLSDYVVRHPDSEENQAITRSNRKGTDDG
jgi:integrase